MWSLGQKRDSMISEKLGVLLAKERGLSQETAAGLRMMQEHGHYVGRKVTYFRIFDPASVKEGMQIRHYSDLDVRNILHAGHIEKDGQVVLNLKPSES